MCTDVHDLNSAHCPNLVLSFVFDRVDNLSVYVPRGNEVVYVCCDKCL